MTLSSDIRRHPDGWIDFDHYRRAAAHERLEARRRAFDRCAGAIRKLVAIIVARSTKVSASPRVLAR